MPAASAQCQVAPAGRVPGDNAACPGLRNADCDPVSKAISAGSINPVHICSACSCNPARTRAACALGSCCMRALISRQGGGAQVEGQNRLTAQVHGGRGVGVGEGVQRESWAWEGAGGAAERGCTGAGGGTPVVNRGGPPANIGFYIWSPFNHLSCCSSTQPRCSLLNHKIN